MSIYLFPQDKANHFIYGAACGLATIAVCHLIKISNVGYAYPLSAVFSATALGIFKEIEDYFANQRAIAQGMPPQHGVEWMDMIATALGGVAIGLANWL